jgi:hypothetical protein
MKRRDFIHRWSRVAMLSGLAGAAGYLIMSGRVSGESECAGNEECKKCSRINLCRNHRNTNLKENGGR